MNVLVVTGHPRSDSLTAKVTELFSSGITDNGHTVELADLYAEGFDPVLRVADEPDWEDPDKQYSPAVQAEMQRVERNDATVMIFPVFWWSMPALQKGWIDRVWNHGWAYGERSYPHCRVWFIGIAGNDEQAYRKRGYIDAMRTQLDVGILDYCGVEDRRLEMLYGSIEGETHVEKILEHTRRLAKEFED
jgi:NAD(P)H dehydrogenase (quinone)